MGPRSSTAGGVGLISGQGTKIPRAARCSQKIKNKNIVTLKTKKISLNVLCQKSKDDIDTSKVHNGSHWPNLGQSQHQSRQ